jgi:hypothetical protein
MGEPSLFDYPAAPGFKEKGGASQDAAAAISPKVDALHLRILTLFENDALKGADGRVRLTADEAATMLRVDRLGIRPRFTELLAEGKIKKTDQRRKNISGQSATVWELA